MPLACITAEPEVIVISSCTAPAGISMCGHRLTRATALALSDKSLFAIARPWERMCGRLQMKQGLKAENADGRSALKRAAVLRSCDCRERRERGTRALVLRGFSVSSVRQLE